MKRDFSGAIYEVNVRQYTEEGTFNAFFPHIDRLHKLGVKTLWFMPIYPIGQTNRKGSLGSYYSISDYNGVNPEFGTLDDFKKIVDHCHKIGMKVILDMVTNHTSWNNIWIIEGHRDWYKQDSNGEIISPYDWSDTAQLDYNNPSMQRAMIDAMKYWISEIGIDGYRQDMAGLVPIEFWSRASSELRKINPDIIMLGEVEDAAYHTEGGFDITYSWELCHMLEHIASGAYGADVLRERIRYEQYTFPEDAGRLLFTSNHDENSWSGTEFARMGEAHGCMAALTYVLSGVPLIYSGQEAGSDKSLEFFEKDLIDWSNLERYSKFYGDLNALRNSCKALEGFGGGGFVEFIDNSQTYNVLSFIREVGDSKVIAIFNLTPYHVQPAIYDSRYSGSWTKLHNGTMELKEGEYDPFGPWEYKIYYR